MKYTEQTGRTYLGEINHALLAYAADEKVRAGAASGGAVSALLLFLMDTKQIDAALVTRICFVNGRIDSEVILATDREAVLSAQTSKYFDVPLLARGRRLIRAFPGKVAVVGLPCHITAFRRMAERDPEMASRMKYTIALFCGHTSERYLLDRVLALKGVDQSEIDSFHFRKGRWRGSMQGTCKDGKQFSFPFRHFSMYHNLNFFCLRRCLSCHDHTGYQSDFSAGDAWLGEMKSQPIKHSIIFARNSRAGVILKDMIDREQLVGRAIDARTVFRAQKRSLIYHYNVTARALAARWHGIHIRDTVRAKVRWNDWLAAQLILANYRISRNPRMRDWIFRLPRPIVFLYFLFLKFLQNF